MALTKVGSTVAAPATAAKAPAKKVTAAPGKTVVKAPAKAAAAKPAKADDKAKAKAAADKAKADAAKAKEKEAAAKAKAEASAAKKAELEAAKTAKQLEAEAARREKNTAEIVEAAAVAAETKARLGEFIRRLNIRIDRTTARVAKLHNAELARQTALAEANPTVKECKPDVKGLAAAAVLPKHELDMSKLPTYITAIKDDEE